VTEVRVVQPGGQLAHLDDADPLAVDAGDAVLGGYAWWQTGPAPAIVLMHGWAQDATYHADRARGFHDAGWHAISVASRGWPGSTGDPDDYGLSAETDIAALADAVRVKDATELWILGYSAGGLAAARGLPATSGVDGVVTVNAPMNVHTEYRDTPAQRMRDYYDRVLTQAHWDRCSPVVVADRIQTPLLAVAGTADSVIPASQAREICALVPTATYHEIEGMRHLPTQDEWRAILTRASDWMGEIRSSR